MLKLLIADAAVSAGGEGVLPTIHSGLTGYAADAWIWLLTPISGASLHDITPAAAWHGRLMLLAWAIILPPVIVVPRFFKVMPGQDWPREVGNPFWFLTHRQLGCWIAIISTFGVAVMLWAKGGPTPGRSVHSGIGWGLFLLCWLQILNSLLRGTHGGPIDPFTRQPMPPDQWHGDHFSMTPRRVIFEYAHKMLGYLLVLVATITIGSGLQQADAPRWMWMAITAWAMAWLFVFIKLQCNGKCVDTYQAIWGLDDELPGNCRKPIGWGITRLKPMSLSSHPTRTSQSERTSMPGEDRILTTHIGSLPRPSELVRKAPRKPVRHA